VLSFLGVSYIQKDTGINNFQQPPGPSEVINNNVLGFFNGLQHLRQSNELIQTMPKMLDLQAAQALFDKTKIMLSQAKESFSQCDTLLLNSIYPGWGDILSQKLLPGLNFYLTMQLNDNTDAPERGDALMQEVNVWWKNNSEKLINKLKTGYGFNIE
jgi:hypothetical protein